MPSYRSGNDEYRRKPPMMYYEKDEEPEVDEEEEELVDDKKPIRKPCICKVEFPFKVLVTVVPCDEFKCHKPM